MRYSPESLYSEFGVSFELVENAREMHHTPFGTERKFIYLLLSQALTFLPHWAARCLNGFQLSLTRQICGCCQNA